MPSPRNTHSHVLLAAFLAAASDAIAAAGGAVSTLAPATVPDGVELQELHRFFWWQRGTSGYHYSGGFLPYGWESRYRYEGSLGFISQTWFAGSRALYNCLVEVPGKAPSPFTSADPGCEGHPLDHFIGHAASWPMEGTVPLYRCDLSIPGHPHHFDTFSATCEGNPHARLDGVLAYVFL
jgi:hypothetical protein